MSQEAGDCSLASLLVCEQEAAFFSKPYTLSLTIFASSQNYLVGLFACLVWDRITPYSLRWPRNPLFSCFSLLVARISGLQHSMRLEFWLVEFQSFSLSFLFLIPNPRLSHHDGSTFPCAYSSLLGYARRCFLFIVQILEERICAFTNCHQRRYHRSECFTEKFKWLR